ncbi:MAG: T9SS type A sorting domain-containing protein [Sphingobacteriales bacterium JAD_PAG50586_3]|nr:MAG: T9SS type A sorting domain-containing protein [Sphingobacteriales bacterium JAD_PAG50586_3]
MAIMLLNNRPKGDKCLAAKAQLSSVEVEMFRQWIYFGAPLTSNVADEAVLTQYYNGLAVPSIPVPAAPAPGTGFQLKLGKIFLAPGEEFEYYIKREVVLPDTVEVTRMDLKMNSFSHHFIVFKYDPGQENDFPDGLRVVNFSNVFPDQTRYLLAWSNPGDISLPQGTAYTFPQSTFLDLNYHINNYSQDSILGAEMYLNVYYQPKGTAQKEMFSDIVLYPVTGLIIPGTNNEMTFTRADYVSGSNLIYNLWSLKSHTHKYGTDYDVYLRNADGSKGQQVYEGFLDEESGVNLGYYNWSHPPTAYYDPLLPFPAQYGLIQEAKFRNCCTQPLVTFGLTTEDEMMLYYVQYTTDIATGTDEDTKDVNMFDAYPNPFNDATNLRFHLDKSSTVSIEVFDNLGRKVFTQNMGHRPQGLNTLTLDAATANMVNGNYLIRLTAGDKVSSKQIMKVN